MRLSLCPLAVHSWHTLTLHAGVTGSICWVGWSSYTSAVRANREQPVFALSPEDLRRLRQAGADPLVTAHTAQLVLGRGDSARPFAERRAELEAAQSGTLQARLASLRLAPHLPEYEEEKLELRRILAHRGDSESPRRQAAPTDAR